MGGVVGNVKNNPAITVNTMSISSFRRDERNRLARVQLNGSTIEGTAADRWSTTRAGWSASSFPGSAANRSASRSRPA